LDTAHYTYTAPHLAAIISMEGTPPAKRRRLLDAGGPIEDDATARQKMRDAKVYDAESEERTGFDPDNVMDAKAMKPMTYFSGEGDLPMMRWLYVNGADATDDTSNSWKFPMYVAAAYGHKEAVEWLFLHGAASDVVGAPFQFLLSREEHRNLVVWLILNGAFCRDDDDSGLLDVEKVTESFGRPSRERSKRVTFATKARQHLLEWAVERHGARTSFLTLLNGTLSRPEGEVSPYLVSLNGKPGILELIADYSGPPLGREARIVRQLAELLPGLYREPEDEEDRWASSPGVY